MAATLLDIRRLTAGFESPHGLLKAVDCLSLQVEQGKTLCVVGESGSGKSVTALAVMRLLDFAGGVIPEGTVEFQGEDLTAKSQEEMLRIRGDKMAMIFQDPMSALNPVFSVGDQIAESLVLHRNMRRKEARREAVELLRMVGIPDPDIRANQYPHQLSGGMCQRVVIAIALACRPALLLADEPTTALDVTVQAQILELLKQLQRELGMSILLITHDMGVAAEMADRIAVMYAGRIMEEGPADAIFNRARHPYTIGLLESIPGFAQRKGELLHTISGSIPSIREMPSGCRFHPRCRHAADRCRTQEPEYTPIGDGHHAACWLLEDSGGSGTPGVRERGVPAE